MAAVATTAVAAITAAAAIMRVAAMPAAWPIMGQR